MQESSRITWPLTLTLTLSTPWMHADLESILWKFGGDPAICLREEAICAKVYRRADRRTDDGRLAIVWAHSWNELKINVQESSVWLSPPQSTNLLTITLQVCMYLPYWWLKMDIYKFRDMQLYIVYGTIFHASFRGEFLTLCEPMCSLIIVIYTSETKWY